jgi:aspartate kinase
LLEVFSVLEAVNGIKDEESVHFESLVAEYERQVQIICDDHIAAAKSHLRDQSICSELVQDITVECRQILDFREAAHRWKLDIDSRSKDRIVSFGEKLSCRFVAALLEDRVGFDGRAKLGEGNLLTVGLFREFLRNMSTFRISLATSP